MYRMTVTNSSVSIVIMLAFVAALIFLSFHLHPGNFSSSYRLFVCGGGQSSRSIFKITYKCTEIGEENWSCKRSGCRPYLWASLLCMGISSLVCQLPCQTSGHQWWQSIYNNYQCYLQWIVSTTSHQYFLGFAIFCLPQIARNQNILVVTVVICSFYEFLLVWSKK